MFTHRSYHLITAALVVVVVALAIQQAIATKASVPATGMAGTGAVDQSFLKEQNGVVQQKDTIHPSYRSPYDECFDVSLRETAGCRKVGQVLIPSYRSPLNGCFDVSLREAAGCQKASRPLVPSNNSQLDECFDVSLSEHSNCQSMSQVPIP